MTEQEVRELYEERLAIMLEGNSRDLEWFDKEELTKRLTRAAYFDTKRQIGDAKMPADLWPDKAKTVEPVQAMRTKAEHIDFGFLKGIIRTNPKGLPSNVDGVYERFGHFLFLEFKRPGEQISQGQWILLKALAAMPQAQVWIITGNFEPGEIYFESAEVLSPNGMRQEIAGSLEVLKMRINTWHDEKSR
jgi:hypothetical protein